MEKSIFNKEEKKNGHSQELNLEFEDLFDRRSNSPAPEPLSDDVEDDFNSVNEKHEPEEVLDPFNSKVDLNNFKLLKLIGKGAYGKVYQVSKLDTDEVFAMKVLNKDFLVKSNNVEYTRAERDILTKVMDFVNGGHILFHLREEAMFAESIVKIYAAEVVLALEFLHSLDIIHRDLKPENILLDASGHVLLTDFGFAKEQVTEENRARTFCGTVEYMSPQMIKGEAYGKETDWWSVGILLFDMLTGSPPFRAKSEQLLQQKILKDKIRLPNYLTADAHSILKGFLNRDQNKRLGSGPNGINDVKRHPFFKGISWKKLMNREIDPPFRPNVPKGKFDTSNFDEEFTKQAITDSPNAPNLTNSQQLMFEGFSYVRTPTETTLENLELKED